MITCKQITCGLLQTNCVILQQDNFCVVFDVPYDCQAVAEYINNNNLTIQAILLTHGHFDHVGGVEQLKRLLNIDYIPIYIHKDDLALAQNAMDNLWKIPSENCYPTHLVREGKLQVGQFEFYVIFTPGHTEGSVIYLIEDVMLSGDTLFCNSVGRTDLPGGNMAKMRKSLQKIKQLTEDYKIYSGHGPCSTLKMQLNNNPYLI